MRRLVLALSALLITACADADHLTTPSHESLLSPDPTFVRLTADGYANARKSGAFWAVKGQQRAISFRFQDTRDVFMRFTVPADALLRRPDGTAFATGDSIRIRVTLDATGKLAFDFQPSGLKFNPDEPAVLRIDYSRTDADIDSDGDVDLFDTLAETTAAIWKRELPMLPWLALPTLHLFGDVVQTSVHDFTGFGMATN